TDPKAHNTFEQPNVITTRTIAVETTAQGIVLTVPPLSATAVDVRA
ncbi:MAG: hypothetical protein RLZZ297_207, partial [Chloroflexota bacterium]